MSTSVMQHQQDESFDEDVIWNESFSLRRDSLQRSQDSGTVTDWSRESNSPTRQSCGSYDSIISESDQDATFVTVLSVNDAVASEPSCYNIQAQPAEFVTVLQIGNEDSVRSNRGVCLSISREITTKTTPDDSFLEEAVEVHRSPGERLGFGLKFVGGLEKNTTVNRLLIQCCAENSPASEIRCSWGRLVEADEIMEISGFQVNTLTRPEIVSKLTQGSEILCLTIRHYVDEKERLAIVRNFLQVAAATRKFTLAKTKSSVSRKSSAQRERAVDVPLEYLQNQQSVQPIESVIDGFPPPVPPRRKRRAKLQSGVKPKSEPSPTESEKSHEPLVDDTVQPGSVPRKPPRRKSMAVRTKLPEIESQSSEPELKNTLVPVLCVVLEESVQEETNSFSPDDSSKDAVPDSAKAETLAETPLESENEVCNSEYMFSQVNISDLIIPPPPAEVYIDLLSEEDRRIRSLLGSESESDTCSSISTVVDCWSLLSATVPPSPNYCTTETLSETAIETRLEGTELLRELLTENSAFLDNVWMIRNLQNDFTEASYTSDPDEARVKDPEDENMVDTLLKPPDSFLDKNEAPKGDDRHLEVCQMNAIYEKLGELKSITALPSGLSENYIAPDRLESTIQKPERERSTRRRVSRTPPEATKAEPPAEASSGGEHERRQNGKKSLNPTVAKQQNPSESIKGPRKVSQVPAGEPGTSSVTKLDRTAAVVAATCGPSTQRPQQHPGPKTLNNSITDGSADPRKRKSTSLKGATMDSPLRYSRYSGSVSSLTGSCDPDPRNRIRLSSTWRRDERSEKSVKDKIALFTTNPDPAGKKSLQISVAGKSKSVGNLMEDLPVTVTVTGKIPDPVVTVTELAERRRKTLSKLRGLVIPDADKNPAKVIQLPRIVSKDSVIPNQDSCKDPWKNLKNLDQDSSKNHEETSDSDSAVSLGRSFSPPDSPIHHDSSQESQESCETSARILKAHSVEAANRRNVLQSAKRSSGGSPKDLQIKALEQSAGFLTKPKNLENDSLKTRASCGPQEKPTKLPVRTAFINEIDEENLTDSTTLKSYGNPKQTIKSATVSVQKAIEVQSDQTGTGPALNSRSSELICHATRAKSTIFLEVNQPEFIAKLSKDGLVKTSRYIRQDPLKPNRILNDSPKANTSAVADTERYSGIVSSVDAKSLERPLLNGKDSYKQKDILEDESPPSVFSTNNSEGIVEKKREDRQEMLSDEVEGSVHKRDNSELITAILHKDGTGLGFSLNGGKDSPQGDKPLTIKKIFSGGPAFKCGTLQVGDEILTINGREVSSMSRIETWNFMKKLPDGTVTVRVKRSALDFGN